MWLQACMYYYYDDDDDYVLGGLGDWSWDFAYRRLTLFLWATSLAICFVLVFKSEAPIGDLHVSVCRVLKLQGWTVYQHFQNCERPLLRPVSLLPAWVILHSGYFVLTGYQMWQYTGCNCSACISSSSEITSTLHQILFLVNICEKADPFLWFSIVDGLDCGSALARFSGVLLLAFPADVCRCAVRALGEHSPLIIACDLNKIACSFKMEEL